MLRIITKAKGGWPRSTRTNNNVESLRKHLEESPSKSTRCLSQEVDLWKTTVGHIMHQDLHLFPNKIQTLQVHTAPNKEMRRTFCLTIRQDIESHTTVIGWTLIIFLIVRHISTSRDILLSRT